MKLLEMAMTVLVLLTDPPGEHGRQVAMVLLHDPPLPPPLQNDWGQEQQQTSNL